MEGHDRRLEPPKSKAGRRAMAVPAWLIDELASLMARRGVTGANPEALLFVSADGTPLHYSNWRRRTWLPALKAAGLTGVVFHDLRSPATTVLIAGGRREDGTTPTRPLLAPGDPGYLRLGTREGDAAAADKVGERFRPRDERAMVPPKRSDRPGK